MFRMKSCFSNFSFFFEYFNIPLRVSFSHKPSISKITREIQEIVGGFQPADILWNFFNLIKILSLLKDYL